MRKIAYIIGIYHEDEESDRVGIIETTVNAAESKALEYLKLNKDKFKYDYNSYRVEYIECAFLYDDKIKKCLNCGSINHTRRGDSIYCECGTLIEILL